MRSDDEYHDIVIAGGGICGLATALALHRKGISSLVLEKHHTLRATGATISIYLNGWHALDQLGVGDELRAKAIPITEIHDAWLHKDEMQIIPVRKECLRCVRRSDLIETMADKLPTESIRFRCQIAAVETDPITSFPIIVMEDGSIIKTKVVIGCDGSNSVVGKSLGLRAAKLFPQREVRGFTVYPNGHHFGSHFLRLRGDGVFLGRIPVDEKLIFWFVDQKFNPKDLETRQDPKLIRDSTVETLKDFPLELIEMVKNSDIDSLSLTSIRYRAPWHLAFENLQRSTITVAGDAMHMMDPSIGQGGCAALEDAVVLARCLAGELVHGLGQEGKASHQELHERTESALCKYVRERRLRVLNLSTKSYLIGSLFDASWLKKLLTLAIFTVFFGGNSLSHTHYHCGPL